MTYQYARGINAADSSVTTLYGERTVLTSCAYLRPYIMETSNVLDVGCGPGTITSDIARIAFKGRTNGVDNSAGIIAQARASFPSSEVSNLTFAIGDAMKLEAFADNSFDIVHAHALLGHIPDPVSALKEFYRVCKPGGIVAVRDASPSITLSLKPDVPAIRKYWERAIEFMNKMGAHSDAGRKLESWAIEAGFEKDGGRILTSASRQWQASHLGRTIGAPAEQTVALGMCTKEEIKGWRNGWEEWEATDGHELVFEAGEILCWKGE